MSHTENQRETFSNRFGFLMLSAACAIGLGNVWRFPYITGKYGGGIFVAVYLAFLLAVLPVMIMEFAIGRASRAGLGKSFSILEKPGSNWHALSWWSLAGCYCLMMFYITVSGWMLAYFCDMLFGSITSLTPNETAAHFNRLLEDPVRQVLFMTISLVFCIVTTAKGLRFGVERVIKIMMVGLFILMGLLVARVLFLPNATAGLSYFLLPDWGRFTSSNFWEICNAAMCQAFFTLGIGIGCMTAIASYYTKEMSLAGEACWIAGMDTVVAILAGLIIFPACFACNINPDSGPGLIFITLPNVFVTMHGGRFWGALFFLFMTFASFSTVIAVVEAIVSHSMDSHGMSRKKASLLHGTLLWILSLPCALGWSTFKNVNPLGPGSTILDLEDFIVSGNLLPLGALLITLFCVLRQGWGFENFAQETNRGSGFKIPDWFRGYLRWVLPLLLILVFIAGYIERFVK
ncbi:MAG: sodium-dependent transporter [Desulfovibrionaceae bacterium]|nr:sodium-dependent transporter [Desulfovibrionaceae bacterium]